MIRWIIRAWHRRQGTGALRAPRLVPITAVPVHVFEKITQSLPSQALLGSIEDRVIVVPGVGVMRLRFEHAMASVNGGYWKFVRAEVLAENAEKPAWDEVSERGWLT